MSTIIWCHNSDNSIDGKSTVKHINVLSNCQPILVLIPSEACGCNVQLEMKSRNCRMIGGPLEGLP